MEDGVKHESKDGEPVKPCQGGRQPFIVAGKSPETGGPGKRALHHPSSWQKDKALPGYLELYHHETDSLPGCLLGRFFSGVTLIDKSHFYFLARSFLHFFHQGGDLRALLLVGRRYFQSQQMPQGVDRGMYFGALFALVSIVARAVATFRCRLQGASIQDDRRRLRLRLP